MARLTKKKRVNIECPPNSVQLRWVSNLGGVESFTFSLQSKKKTRSNISVRLEETERFQKIISKSNQTIWGVVAEKVSNETGEAIASILTANKVYFCVDYDTAKEVSIIPNTLNFLKINENLITITISFSTGFEGGV